MSRSKICASHRTQAIARHMSSVPQEAPVVFESSLAMRKYILNRPVKLNALDELMLNLLRAKIEEWSASNLCGVIVGTGVGRAFCAGGDVAGVVENAADPVTRSKAIDFFKREFEMDYILATLEKPYVAILDGFTMGGGVGLAAHAPFRVATERTVLAMPETKIGYCPDVGASYFLSRLDGQIGTYLGLTSQSLEGRAVFEHGFATHFIPSRRVPLLLDRLSALEDPTKDAINRTIEELSAERQPDEPPAPLTGDIRSALDLAFRHNTVEMIFADLHSLSLDDQAAVRTWASETLATLQLRSPTSLKVALEALRRGKHMTLLAALDMELKIAAAYCNGASPDFATGVKAVLVDKAKSKPLWLPSTIDEVTPTHVAKFFAPDSPYLASAPQLTLPEHLSSSDFSPLQYALPSEEEIGSVVRGSHKTGGATGIRLDELISKFGALRSGKIGVREKIIEVVNRKCEIVDNSDGNRVWLKWKYNKD